MRTNLASAYSSAIQSRDPLIICDLIWVEGLNRSTGATETIGFSSLQYPANLSVISGKTRATVSRDYYPGYGLISTSPIPLTADLTIQQVHVILSQLDDNAQQAIRGYDPRNAWIEIHQALFNTDTRELISAAEPHFVGRIDKAPIDTPKIGGEGSIDLTISSDLRELTRTNAAMKSDEQQKLRSGDRMRQYNSTAGEWQIYWGEAKPSVRASGGGPDTGRSGPDT